MNLYLYSQVRAVDFGLADDLWEHSQHWEPPQLSTFFHCDMLLAIVALENYVSSNWWLLREGGFLRRKASNRCLFPLCTPKKAYAPLQCFFPLFTLQKAISPLTVLFSTVSSPYDSTMTLLRLAFWGVNNRTKHCQGAYGFLGSTQRKQARKSSEDAQAGGYARYKFVWAG